jgi:hypothetical protein
MLAEVRGQAPPLRIVRHISPASHIRCNAAVKGRLRSNGRRRRPSLSSPIMGAEMAVAAPNTPGPTRRKSVPKLPLSLIAALALASSLLAVSSHSAEAAALTNPSWTVSNNQAGAVNVNYAYSFKTATAGGVIKTITFVVSGASLGGAPAIVVAYGIGAGTVARAGQTITYTVTAAVAVSAGIPIFIEFSTLTNPVAGAFTTAINTVSAVPATIDNVTPGPSVTFAGGNTAKAIVVAKSLTFTLDTPAFTLAMDPSLPALADQSQVINLTVLTNANSGYTLTVSDLAAHLQGGGAGNPVIAQVSTGKATSLAWPGAPRTGYTVTGTGVGLIVDAAFSGAKFAGYTSAGEVIGSRASATGGTADTIAITDRTAIDYSVQALTFTDTITYTVTPNYT